jgi:squalene synthase HpnD
VTWIAFISLAIWIVLIGGRDGFWRADQRLGKPPEPDAWPDVAVLIPARNEAEVIGRTLPAVLGQDYPGNFKVILIDDNSQDGTGDIARGLGSDKLSVITGEPLPSGWMGKMWALEQGMKAAGGFAPKAQYIWLTDADITHRPDVLANLVAMARAEGHVMVSLMARLNCESFWEKLLIPAFVFFFQKLYPFPSVNDPDSGHAAAAGGCVLADRKMLEQAGGFAAIKGEVIDDCALARRMKGQGSIWLGLTESTVSLRHYGDLSSIWLMVARTAFVQLRHSWLLLALSTLGMSILYLAPPVSLVWGLLGGGRDLALAGAAAWLMMGLAYRPTTGLYRLDWGWTMTLPLAGLLYGAMTLDSARRFHEGKGAPWKGRTHGDGGPVPDHEDPTQHVKRVVERSGSSFYWAMKSLPEIERRALFAVYAFCREVDDIADEPGEDAAKRAALQTWRDEVEALYAGRPVTLPTLKALGEARLLFPLVKEDLIAVIDGMEMDAGAPIQAPSRAEFDLYCERVACAVGRLVLTVLGIPRDKAVELADAQGRALQTTNILRDLAEDAERGRLYLPKEMLEEAGIPISSPAKVLAHPALPRVCQSLADEARAYFDTTGRLMDELGRKRLKPPAVMAAVYSKILDGLNSRGWTRLSEPVGPSKLAKLVIALRILLL